MSDLLMDKVPELRARLQRMKDAPEGPMQAAFKKHVLDTMSDPIKWADGIVPVAWFGLQQFEEGWNAACARPAEEVQRDAERYQYLRECNSGSLVIVHIMGMGDEDQVVLTEADADSAIDAALAASKAKTAPNHTKPKGEA